MIVETYSFPCAKKSMSKKCLNIIPAITQYLEIDKLIRTLMLNIMYFYVTIDSRSIKFMRISN